MSEEQLRFEHPRSEQIKRLIGSDVLNLLPYPVYKKAVALIKLGRKKKAFVEPELPQHQENSRGEAGVWLTHDIDTKACYGFLPAVLDMEERAGLRSTVHFLTKGPYKISSALLDEMEDRGFEIGLHGDSHDMAMGFRSEKNIEKRIASCVSSLGRPVKSYRAPALGISERLLGILKELGFTTDSSITAKCFYKNGVEQYHAYKYPEIGIIEAPLSIQDTNLFADCGLDDADALKLCEKIMGFYKSHKGLFVFNGHPIHLESHPQFFENLLAQITKDPGLISVSRSGDLTF